MGRTFENNIVFVEGEVASDFTFSHESFGEKFYETRLIVRRSSGNADEILVVVSEIMVDVNDEWKGQHVRVEGDIRSYNKNEGEKNRLIIYLFSKEFIVLDAQEEYENLNEVSITGFVCKIPQYRKTPLGREITDILLAVNRPYGKSDYIPCICWGRSAVFASRLDVGMNIKIEGRLQSREYIKKLEDGTQEMRTAYEVSISKMDVLKETED